MKSVGMAASPRQRANGGLSGKPRAIVKQHKTTKGTAKSAGTGATHPIRTPPWIRASSTGKPALLVRTLCRLYYQVLEKGLGLFDLVSRRSNLL